MLLQSLTVTFYETFNFWAPNILIDRQEDEKSKYSVDDGIYVRIRIVYIVQSPCLSEIYS